MNFEKFKKDISKEWELTPVQQDFWTLWKNQTIDEMPLISEEVYNKHGVFYCGTKNIEIKDLCEKRNLILFRFSPDKKNSVYLLFNDFFEIGDLLYFFRKVIDDKELKEFFDKKETEVLKLVFKTWEEKE